MSSSNTNSIPIIAIADQIHASVVASGQIPFEKQMLLTFHEQRKFAKMNKRAIVNPSNVDIVVGIDRNRCGQIYAIPDLDISSHGTIPIQDFLNIISNPFPSILNSERDFTPHSRKVRFLHIQSSQNAVCPSEGVCVINDGHEWCLEHGNIAIEEVRGGKRGGRIVSINNPIEYCQSQVVAMFQNGLCDHFIHEKKKRSGLSNHTAPENTIASHCSISFASIVDQTMYSGSKSSS